MTRNVRGRTFICVAIILALIALMALYHNSLAQIDAIKKTNEVCHHQQESLSAQLQVIIEYKNRLEKSLQSEKSEHKQTRIDLQQKLENEKMKNEKNNMEANIRYSSLQQQYKLSQSQNEDYKEKQNLYQNEKIQLEKSIQELRDHVKHIVEEKDKQFQSLKSDYVALQNERDRLRSEIENIQNGVHDNESHVLILEKENFHLKNEIDNLKLSCNTAKHGELDHLSLYLSNAGDTTPGDHLSFEKQMKIHNDTYRISNSDNTPINAAIIVPGDNLITVLEKNGKKDENTNKHVLPQPNMKEQEMKISSSKITTKSSVQVSKRVDDANPLVLPTIPTKNTSKKMANVNENIRNVLPVPKLMASRRKAIPQGVVIPENIGDAPLMNNINTNKPEDLNIDSQPNRYRNSILEEENNLQKPLKKPKPDTGGAVGDNPAEANINQNNAMEVVDVPNKDNVQDVQEDPFGMMDIQNHVPESMNKKQHIDTLGKGVLGRRGVRIGNGMNYEEGEYDKDKGGDLQLEEAEPEGEEDDDGDYNDRMGARQKDPAIRN